MSEQKNHISTVCLHGGYTPEKGEPRCIPIVQSTTYKYENSQQLGDLFSLEESGYFYSRLANPTNDKVAARICELEEGVAAMLTSSGQSATFIAIFNIANCGDHVVASSALYGGTHNLFAVTMKKMGIEFTFVDVNATEEELKAAFRPNTKAMFAETLGNPSLVVLDLELFSKVAHEQGVPLIVDNTLATPYGCKPFKWGADIVVHSTTKYLEGHATSVGGAIVDSGKFPWGDYPEKFPGMCSPDPSYHGIVYTNKFGEGAYITKAVVQVMRDLGACAAPMNSFLLNVGLETLPLRMQKHTSNALNLARYLQVREEVEWVRYPNLPEDPERVKARKYMPQGGSGVVTFGLKGGREAAEKFMAATSLISVVTHIADSKTCMLHPASTTHRQMGEEELKAAGVSSDLIRLSVGLEDIGDLMGDIEQALESLNA